MEYRNKKTGFTFFSECKIGGDDWETVNGKTTQPAAIPVKKEEDIPEKNESFASAVESDALANVTKKEIMQELDAMGIKYDPRAKKEVLYDLMVGE